MTPTLAVFGQAQHALPASLVEVRDCPTTGHVRRGELGTGHRMDVDSSQAATALLTEHLQYTPLVSDHCTRLVCPAD